MTERRSLSQRLSGGRETSSLPAPAKGPPLHHRPLNEGAPLQEVLQEQYVLCNCSRLEIEQIIRSPELIAGTREQLGESFSSEEFKP